MKPKIRPNKKQHIAWTLLLGNTVKYLLYGGSAGGGKTWLGCEWLFYFCYRYPGTRWFIGRKQLKTLRKTTLETLYKVLKHHKVPKHEYTYHGNDNYMEFSNGSRIDLLDLAYFPSDPMYERFGSYEFTGGWIEEGGEIDFGAFDVLRTRINRWMNVEYGITSKLLITCNPKKNWLYTIFYRPWRDGELPSDHAFIQAFVHDNVQYIGESYLHDLENIKDRAKRERLLLGNWEYDDDPSALIDFDAIIDLFTNDHIGEDQYTNKKYITADIARFGNDKTVIMVWYGNIAKRVITLENSSIANTADRIKEISIQEKIGMSKVIVDEDGVGGGVRDILRCKGFLNGGKPIEQKGKPQNYANLKSQCYYILAEAINERKILVNCDQQIRERLTEELEQVKQKNVDSDRKLAVMPKEQVTKILGHSPDYSDTLMMRMYFDLKPSGTAKYHYS